MNTIKNSSEDDFQRIRDGLHVPRVFPDEVLREAEAVSNLNLNAPEIAAQYADLRSVPFVTIDPPGSRDLDQAFFAARQDDGYQVRYAIADVGCFVARGSAIEQEAWRRGLTLYSPDIRTLLYPPMLSENCASLLPSDTRPAIVFSFALDARGEVQHSQVARAFVRSRVQLAYPQVGAHLVQESVQAGSGSLAGQDWSESLSLLKEIGMKRQQLEAERGGVSLRIPSQHVERWSTALTGYRLAFETASEVEEWNAQISLLTGMSAARMMIEHGVGLLRSLAPPRPDRIQALRLTAKALNVHWPSDADATASYADFVRSLNPHNPLDAVMLHQAARVTGGARYVAFTGEPPSQSGHAGLAAFYSHTTAPLRRLADRYVLDLLVVLSKGETPDASLLKALTELPQVMSEADGLSRRLESLLVDYVEARLIQERIGEVFEVVVIALRGEGVVVQIADPPIRTLLPVATFSNSSNAQSQSALSPVLSDDGSAITIGDSRIVLGQSLTLRLEATDVENRLLHFKPV